MRRATFETTRSWGAAALAIALSAACSAEPTTGPTEDGWLTSFAEAKRIATAENKPILMEFTGTDWCTFCKKLHAEVFAQPQFTEWSKKVVLLQIDFPEKKSQPGELKRQNSGLQAQYKINAYPTIVFVEGDGKEIGRVGYVEGGPGAWIPKAQQALDRR